MSTNGTSKSISIEGSLWESRVVSLQLAAGRQTHLGGGEARIAVSPCFESRSRGMSTVVRRYPAAR
jgi:hypothetical protein